MTNLTVLDHDHHHFGREHDCKDIMIISVMHVHLCSCYDYDKDQVNAPTEELQLPSSKTGFLLSDRKYCKTPDIVYPFVYMLVLNLLVVISIYVDDL